MKFFTEAEDTLLRGMRRRGVRPQAMMSSFPGRTYKSLTARLAFLGLTGDGMPRGPRRKGPGTAVWMRGADDLGPFPKDNLDWCESEWASRLAGAQFSDRQMAGA